MNPGNRRGVRRFYEFDSFRLDPFERVFTRHGQRIPLAPKAFDTLLVLVQHSGRVLSKEELIKTLWPDSFVEENNLTQHISALRRALASVHPLKDAMGVAPQFENEQAYIETVPKLGYRFVCEVREIADPDLPRENASEIFVSKRTRTRIVLREEVEELEDDSSSQPQPPSQVSGIAKNHPMSVEPAPASRFYKSARITIFVLSLAALAAWFAFRRQSSDAAPTGNLTRLTFDSGLTLNPSLSPDGRLIAYASDRSGKGNLDLWVQPISGGPALRLTHDSQNDYAPAFSPDGRTVAFRSERDGGGIYVVSARGSAPRLIVSDGTRPRFSPDGKWIAYWAGSETEDNTGAFMVPGIGRMYLIPASGGTPKEIRPEFAAAGYPIWTPDGRHLLFLGNRDPNVYHEATIDWWVTSIDDDSLFRTGVSAVVKQMGFASASQVPEAWTADGTGVLMSATLADTRNIWRVPISSKDWKISGPPQRLTFGTATDMQPSMSGNNLVFASVAQKLDVWSLSLDTNRPAPGGNPGRITTDAFAHTYPAISPDGTKLAFSLQRAGDRDIWIEDLQSGTETAVSIPPGPSFNPGFSPDGNTLLYRASEKGTSVAYAVPVTGGDTRVTCSECSDYGWSSDQERLVLVGTSPPGLSLLDLATKRRTPFASYEGRMLWNARFSPDDRWIAFNATGQGESRIFVAPVEDGHQVPERDWVLVAGSGSDDKPRWSPDGNTLYFISERDGFRCIWAQKLDGHKRPTGPVVPVFHGHDSRHSLADVGPGDLSISVARDKLVFNMSERAGNLWLTTISSR